MLSIYLILVVSGLAAAGLSFLTWVILLLSLGEAAITAPVIAAIGLTYFLLHVLLLTMLRFNLKALLFARRSHAASDIGRAPSWVQLAGGITSALKRSPALRKAAWGIVAAAAVLLVLARGTAGPQSQSRSGPSA